VLANLDKPWSVSLAPYQRIAQPVEGMNVTPGVFVSHDEARGSDFEFDSLGLH